MDIRKNRQAEFVEEGWIKIAYLPHVDTAGRIIHASVADQSPFIFEIIFQSRYTEHKDYGYHGDLLAEGIYGWHPIK